MLEDELRERFKGRVVVIGIGNTMRGDDGFGPRMLSELAGKVPAGLLDVGEIPESYVGRILSYEAQTILLLDACDFGEPAGTAAILEAEDLGGTGVSTHQLPLELFVRFLIQETKQETQQESGADVFLLGVQPKDLGLGSEMSSEVESTVQILSDVLIRALKQSEPAQLTAAKGQVNL